PHMLRVKLVESGRKRLNLALMGGVPEVFWSHPLPESAASTLAEIGKLSAIQEWLSRTKKDGTNFLLFVPGGQ
ncbi:MAG: hypothetical protein WBE76_19460, partial [Terracidiphilus sp.]